MFSYTVTSDTFSTTTASSNKPAPHFWQTSSRTWSAHTMCSINTKELKLSRSCKSSQVKI